MAAHRRPCAILMTVALASASTTSRGASADAPAWDPATTHAIIVGVLNWKSSSLSTYAVDDRKDRELYDTLIARGVPESQMALLLDQEATLENIRRELREVCGKTRAGDTFVFYYAGHGSAVDGHACLMNYDVDPDDAKTSLLGSEIAEILQANFHGRRVLFFADCCYSGALAKAAEELSQHGVEAATLTSASNAVTSTNNWTFTYLLIEMLRGNPDSDRNDDGAITLGEAATEVADAMKYRENQNSGHSRFGVPEEFRLSATTRARTDADVPQPFELYEFVQIQRRGRWFPARIVDFRDGTFVAEVQRYATRDLVKVDRDGVRKFQAPSAPPAAVVCENPLGAREALAKARVDGKYADLLDMIEVDADLQTYGEFHDYGRFEATSYAGNSDLPAGFWVYVYPHWFIWKDQIR